MPGKIGTFGSLNGSVPSNIGVLDRKKHMYTGRVGIIQAARRPTIVCVVSGGKINGNIKGKRPIALVSVKVGHYIMENAIALFDTGATETVLCLRDGRKKIAEDPQDSGYIQGIDGTLKDVYFYDASLQFPNGASVNVGWIDVYEGAFDYADIIIGMDVIGLGKLHIDGKSGTFSFEI